MWWPLALPFLRMAALRPPSKPVPPFLIVGGVQRSAYVDWQQKHGTAAFVPTQAQVGLRLRDRDAYRRYSEKTMPKTAPIWVTPQRRRRSLK